MASEPPPSRAPSRDLLERSIHDLKNPLAVVRASLEWLETELEGRGEALDALHDASAATARLVAIVEDLAWIAQLDAGAALSLGPVPFGEVIGRITAGAAARLRPRQISIASSAPARLTALGDQRLIERVIDALVDACARGASPGACIELEARDDSSTHVVLEVGLRGAVEAAGPRGSIDDLSSGGIGVYLASRVVEAHGGTLEVVLTASAPRVIVRLPA